MSPESQRIAIAEACGWDVIEVVAGLPFGILDSRIDESPRGIPDYLNDLNAMHEAEKLLPARHRATYVYWLNAGYAVGDAEDTWLVATTTASQRAEAFLRTLGKWEE